MATIGTMKPRRYRKPAEGSIHVRLVPALSEKVRVWLARHGREHKYMGQKLGLEGLGTLLIVAFLDQMDDAQRARLLEAATAPAEAYEHEFNRAMAAWDAGEAAEEAPSRPAVALGKPTKPRVESPPRKARGA